MPEAAPAFRPEWKDRRLGVVMFLDMVGYSAHMSRNEEHALARVQHLSVLLHETVPGYAGRLVKFLGDGTMAEFPTAVAAVACSLAILDAIRVRNLDASPADRYDVRIGLHLGDVIERDGDLFGDTVNVAARIQPLADPGGLAMTSNVYFAVRTQLPLRGAFLGYPRLKNISERLRLYAVPPAHLPFVTWYLTRRNPLNTRLRAVLAAVAVVAVGIGSWFAGGTGAPRAALLFVRPATVAPAAAPAALEFARQVADEINARGGAVPGWQWLDRGRVLALLSAQGVTDPLDADGADRAAAAVARKGRLAWLVSGRLDESAMGDVRFSAKVVDTATMAVVGSFTVASDRPARLAEILVEDLTKWQAARATPAPAAKRKPRRR